MSTEPGVASPVTERPSAEPLVARVLRLRMSRRERAALRRGARPITRPYALPLIGAYVRPYEQEAAFRFAALCATFHGTGHQSGRPLGRALRLSDPTRGDAEGPIARRLFVLQRQPLVLADSTIRSVLTIAAPPSVDWNDVLWLLRLWDHTDLGRRVEVRQRLLRDFYMNTGAPESLTTDPPERNEES